MKEKVGTVIVGCFLAGVSLLGWMFVMVLIFLYVVYDCMRDGLNSVLRKEDENSA